MNNVLLVVGVGSVDTLTAVSCSFLTVDLRSYHYPLSGTFLLRVEGWGGKKYHCICKYREATDANRSILRLGGWPKQFLELVYGIFGWGFGPPELRQELAACGNTLYLGQVSMVSAHLGLTEGHVLGGVLRGGLFPKGGMGQMMLHPACTSLTCWWADGVFGDLGNRAGLRHRQCLVHNTSEVKV